MSQLKSCLLKRRSKNVNINLAHCCFPAGGGRGGGESSGRGGGASVWGATERQAGRSHSSSSGYGGAA